MGNLVSSIPEITNLNSYVLFDNAGDPTFQKNVTINGTLSQPTSTSVFYVDTSGNITTASVTSTTGSFSGLLTAKNGINNTGGSISNSGSGGIVNLAGSISNTSTNGGITNSGSIGIVNNNGNILNSSTNGGIFNSGPGGFQNTGIGGIVTSAGPIKNTGTSGIISNSGITNTSGTLSGTGGVGGLQVNGANNWMISENASGSLCFYNTNSLTNGGLTSNGITTPFACISPSGNLIAGTK